LVIGPQLDRPVGGLGPDAVAVAIEADQTGLRGADIDLAESVEGPADRHKRRALRLQHLPHSALTVVGMAALTSVGDATVLQLPVQLFQRLHVRARNEQALA
jgi:hypothetical protein